MRIAVFGAGAVGTFFGALLARAGLAVTLIARGDHGEAMRRNGVTVRIGGESFTVRPRCTATAAEAGPQDLVLMTVKAHAVPEAAAALAPMLGPDTLVAGAQNGIPWWYFHGLGGALEGLRLRTVDPDGRAWNGIGPERAIGCVINSSNALVEPGVVLNHGNRTLWFGEPKGPVSDRCRRIADAMATAGIDTRVEAHIRDSVWNKLLGNISFSQIAVLTHSTLGPIVDDPTLQAFGRRIMDETQAVAASVGARTTGTIDERIEMSRKVGQHKTSILVDLERGRRMEIDAQVGAVIEIARRTGVVTPTIDLLYALVRRRAVAGGCYPPDAPLPW